MADRSRFLILLAGLCLFAAPVARASWFSSEDRVSVRQVAERYVARIEVQGKNVCLRSGRHTWEFEPGSRRAVYDGVQVWLNAPLKRSLLWRWTLAKADVLKVMDPLVFPAAGRLNRRIDSIVIDPGHGGADQGTHSRRNVKEKDMTLDVARRVRQNLAGCGIPVTLTRDGDRALELTDRTTRAARAGGDVFVSLHFNHADDPNVAGIETYVLALPGYPSTSTSQDSHGNVNKYSGNAYDASNGLLGYYLHRRLLSRTKAEDHGVRRARFVVLKEAPAPAALVECGYLSSAAEEGRIVTEAYRETLAQAIAAGILDFVQLHQPVAPPPAAAKPAAVVADKLPPPPPRGKPRPQAPNIAPH